MPSGAATSLSTLQTQRQSILVHPARASVKNRARQHCPAAACQSHVTGSNSQHASAAKPTEAVQVYVATIPLVGFEEAARRLGALYPDQLALHTLVILQDAAAACTAYDFLPVAPTSPLTAARLLTGGTVPGELRVRRLRGLPRHRCYHVGVASLKAVAQAEAFQTDWNPDLQLFRNDCRHHTTALVYALTGRRLVLTALSKRRR